jgi:glycoprotein endo-alpha-1,2-mannosidase
MDVPRDPDGDIETVDSNGASNVADEEEWSWEDEPSSSDEEEEDVVHETHFSPLVASPFSVPGLPMVNSFDDETYVANNRSDALLMEPPVERDDGSADAFLDEDDGTITKRSRMSTAKMNALRLVFLLALFGAGVAVGVLILMGKDAGTSSSSSSSSAATGNSSGQNSATTAPPDTGPNAGVPTRPPWVTPTIDNIFAPSFAPTPLLTFGPSRSRAPMLSPLPSSVPTAELPSYNPTNSPTEIAADDVTNGPSSFNTGNSTNTSSDYLVGVYYYPWHGDEFHKQQGYVRKQIVPRQYPSLGEYNDSDPTIIAEHIKMFQRANVGLLVTSWWGPRRLEDNNTRNVIMEHPDIGTIRVALHYETSGRLGKEVEEIENARSDVQYMCENYFDHPNYYKIDGRPVLVIYISRHLYQIGKLDEALLTMRSTAAKCGHNLYLVGDQVFSEAPDPDEVHVPFWYFDAVTNYDIYGSAGRPKGFAGREAVLDYYLHMAEWRDKAMLDGCRFIPAVSPGYNDRGVRLEADNPALSRRLTADSEEGSLFHFQLKHAKGLADPAIENLILVNSFNEWHEDTQIEPVAWGEPAEWPPLKTQGLEYVGYGNLYLDILGSAVSSSIEGGGIFDYLYDET